MVSFFNIWEAIFVLETKVDFVFIHLNLSQKCNDVWVMVCNWFQLFGIKYNPQSIVFYSVSCYLNFFYFDPFYSTNRINPKRLNFHWFFLAPRNFQIVKRSYFHNDVFFFWGRSVLNHILIFLFLENNKVNVIQNRTKKPEWNKIKVVFEKWHI